MLEAIVRYVEEDLNNIQQIRSGDEIDGFDTSAVEYAEPQSDTAEIVKWLRSEEVCLCSDQPDLSNLTFFMMITKSTN